MIAVVIQRPPEGWREWIKGIFTRRCHAVLWLAYDHPYVYRCTLKKDHSEQHHFYDEAI